MGASTASAPLAKLSHFDFTFQIMRLRAASASGRRLEPRSIGTHLRFPPLNILAVLAETHLKFLPRESLAILVAGLLTRSLQGSCLIP